MDSKLMLIVATLALAATGSFMAMNQNQAVDMTSGFEAFKSKHGKTYVTEEEEAYRFAVYVQNMNTINTHNSENHSYTMAENQFADLSHEEFRNLYLGLKPTSNAVTVDETPQYGSTVDWTSQLNAVKDQGQCGSCWAFSAMGSAEGVSHIVSGNTLENFAEQQLVDCDTSSSGCNGGLMDYAFSHLESSGICLTSSYRYTAQDGSCKESSCSKSSARVSNYHDCSGTSALKSALNSQPVSVAVDANNWSFYSGGVFSNCGSSLDHGVVLVGIESNGVWKVRNSWAASWGESGYIRLAAGNTCGLANQPSYPTVA